MGAQSLAMSKGFNKVRSTADTLQAYRTIFRSPKVIGDRRRRPGSGRVGDRIEQKESPKMRRILTIAARADARTVCGGAGPAPAPGSSPGHQPCRPSSPPPGRPRPSIASRSDLAAPGVPGSARPGMRRRCTRARLAEDPPRRGAGAGRVWTRSATPSRFNAQREAVAKHAAETEG